MPTPRMPRPIEQAAATASVVLIALAAAATTLIACRLGIGVTYDSWRYLEGARALADGDGYGSRVLMPDGVRFLPIVWWPPLYSATLAVASLVSGLDANAVAPAVHATIFAVNVLLVALIVRGDVRSPWPAVLAAALVASSVDQVRAHATAYSEPLFTTCTLACLWLTAMHARRPILPLAALAGAMAGLGYLTRYAGLATIPYVGLALLVLGPPRPWLRRFGHAVVGVAVGFAFVAAWMVRNRLLDTPSLGRDAAFPDLRQQWALAYEGVTHATLAAWRWVFPPEVVGAGLGVVLVGVGVFGVAVIVGIAAEIWRRRREEVVGWPEAATPVVIVFGGFVAMHVASLLVAKVYFDPAIPVGWRILAPAHVVLTIAVVCGVARLVAGIDGRAGRVVTVAATVLALFTIVSSVYASSLKMAERYAREEAREPRPARFPAAAWAYAALPDDAYLLTNKYALLQFGSRRPWFVAQSPRRGASAAALAEQGRLLRERGGALIYWEQWRLRTDATVDAMAAGMDLVPLPGSQDWEAIVLVPRERVEAYPPGGVVDRPE